MAMQMDFAMLKVRWLDMTKRAKMKEMIDRGERYDC
jgi:hypothetical protein